MKYANQIQELTERSVNGWMHLIYVDSVSRGAFRMNVRQQLFVQSRFISPGNLHG